MQHDIGALPIGEIPHQVAHLVLGLVGAKASERHQRQLPSTCRRRLAQDSPCRLRKAEGLCHYVLMPARPPESDEPPPFLGTWRRVYTAILIYLCLIIFGFYLFTRAYR